MNEYMNEWERRIDRYKAKEREWERERENVKKKT